MYFLTLFLVLILQVPADVKLSRVFLLNARVLQPERQSAQVHADKRSDGVRAARAEADTAMSEGPFSVMQKNATPSSGDKPDYTSLAPYFGPDPDTHNRFPYLLRHAE